MTDVKNKNRLDLSEHTIWIGYRTVRCTTSGPVHLSFVRSNLAGSRKAKQSLKPRSFSHECSQL